jgi:hypothetical protein
MFRGIYQHNKLHAERQKCSFYVGSSHNSRSLSAKIYCSSIDNSRISSVGAIYITKSKVAQIICRSNINSLLTQDMY